MSKHEVIIYWSTDDKAFIAEVPELPGCAAQFSNPRDASYSRKSPGYLQAQLGAKSL